MMRQTCLDTNSALLRLLQGVAVSANFFGQIFYEDRERGWLQPLSFAERLMWSDDRVQLPGQASLEMPGRVSARIQT